MKYLFLSKKGAVTHSIESSKPLKKREIKKQLRFADKIAAAKERNRRYEERKERKERRRAESARGRAKERRITWRDIKKELPYYAEKEAKRERKRKRRAKRAEAILGAYRSARRKVGYSYGTRKKRRSKKGSGLSLGGYNL
jgi:hypothetical protein